MSVLKQLFAKDFLVPIRTFADSSNFLFHLLLWKCCVLIQRSMHFGTLRYCLEFTLPSKEISSVSRKWSQGAFSSVNNKVKNAGPLHVSTNNFDSGEQGAVQATTCSIFCVLQRNWTLKLGINCCVALSVKPPNAVCKPIWFVWQTAFGGAATRRWEGAMLTQYSTFGQQSTWVTTVLCNNCDAYSYFFPFRRMVLHCGGSSRIYLVDPAWRMSRGSLESTATDAPLAIRRGQFLGQYCLYVHARRCEAEKQP